MRTHVRNRRERGFIAILLCAAAHGLLAVAPALARATVGAPGADDLVITREGRAVAVIVIAAGASALERQAAAEIAKYVEMMSGGRPALAREPAEIEAAMTGTQPLIVVGEKAFEMAPGLRQAVQAAAKPNPHLRADAIVLRRAGRRLFVAGNSEFAHSLAAVELLRRWGVRWYMPGEFGECVPVEPDLAVGDIDWAYGSPFEVRDFWISWLGDPTGAVDFKRHNMLGGRAGRPPSAHALGRYTKGLGKSALDFAITGEATAEYVARGVEPLFARGQNFSLAMEDGLYQGRGERDQDLLRLRWDKYFLRWSVTDAMLELYSGVLRNLRTRHPDSRSKIGLLAYSNMTLPPVRDVELDRALFVDLAPIDIDPSHGIDDPRSPARAEYGEMMRRWAKVTKGRLTIYDYDQGMLVWRDLPNPSHMAFRHDVQHYRLAGILGVDTESRNALVTTFINLHLRAQLLWNPDVDVDALIEEFFVKFYGTAAGPMRRYWQAIFQAWSNTIVTEHEYFVIPAIYTPSLVAALREELGAAEEIVRPLSEKADPTRGDRLLLDRMRFTRLGFELIDSYTAMERSASAETDFAAAITAGERGLAARAALTAMNTTFTTTRMESGYAWWPGEVKQYLELRSLTDGQRGRLVSRLPIEWAFRRDEKGTGEKRGFVTQEVDLGLWNARGSATTGWLRKDYPDAWELVRTDLYAQAQGILHVDGQSFRGYLWYRTDVDVTEEQAKQPLRLMFPGLFGACRLFVGGEEMARREQSALWWHNDYRFQWDVDLSGELKAGTNRVALACRTDGHLGGLFRRAFLYTPVASAAPSP